MKKLLLLLMSCLLMTPSLKASHLIGGEITWECVKTPGANFGKFIFTVKKYRTCKVGSATGVLTPQIINPFGGSIPTSQISQGDISPSCYDPAKELDCFGGTTLKQNDAIEEFVFRSAPVTLTGTPSPGGSIFYVDECCRPTGCCGPDGIRNSTSEGSFIWRAIMYPYYVGGVAQPLSSGATPNCYDSSPRFVERPAAIICTDYAFTYNHNAFDPDLDSLAFYWAPSWTGTVGGSIVYTPGFSFNNPLPSPGVPSNPNNVAATIDVHTGEIKFKSYDAGRYYTNVQVDSYRCGQRIASIFREIPVNLLNCAPLPPPFSTIYNVPPAVSISYKGTPTSTLALSVLAGEVVEFQIQASDGGFLPGLVPQKLELKPTGIPYGNLYSDTLNGCLNPPCATLDTTSKVPFGYYIHGQNTWKGTANVKTKFKWKTDCNHLSQQIGACVVLSNVYTFIFKVLDDYCPAPGANFVTASITINAPDPLPPPALKCLNVLPNGDVHLSWNVPVTDLEDTANSFRKYVIYRANTRNAATYTAIDTILLQDISDYTDVGANAHTTPKYYFIMGVSSCNDQARRVVDTLATPTLDATVLASGDSVKLTWPHFKLPGVFPSTAIAKYYVWQIYNNDTTLIDSTTSNLVKYSMNDCLGGVKLCYPSDIYYYIEIKDTTLGWACSSISNTEFVQAGDNTPPVGPTIQTATVDPATGNILINWTSTDCDIKRYYIHQNGVIIDSVSAPTMNYSVPSPTGSPYNIPPTTFSISAKDSCDNVGTPGLAHTTMEASIFGAGVSRCEVTKKIPVKFGAYDGWPVARYELMADTGSGFYVIQTYNPPFSFPITFNFSNVNDNFYRFKVVAYSGTGVISESSMDSLTMKVIDGTVIGPPDVRCVAQDPNGDIRIIWIPPVNTSGNFDSYIIEHSTDGTTFSVLDSLWPSSRSNNLVWDSTGYTHVNPGSGRHYYRIFSRSGCYGYSLSTPSAVVQALKLEIAPQGISVNQLKWFFNPVPTSQSYSVYREFPIGSGLNWVTDLPNNFNTLNDTLFTCNDTVNYQVIIKDQSGCESNSLVRKGVFKDDVAPPKHFMDSVSVIDDTSAILGWSASTAPDAVIYYVIRKLPSGIEFIDTLTGGQLSYVKAGLKGCYAIVAADSCGNDRLATGDFNYHCTMDINVSVDRCDESFLLQWNAYDAFTSGTDVQYQLFVAVNGQEFKPYDVTDKTNLRFTEAITGSDYCFFVRATENEGAGPFTSTSDSVCISANFLNKPAYSYLQHVTVVDSNQIELSLWVDLEADVSEYVIHRGLDTNNMRSVKTILVPRVSTRSDSVVSYIDQNPRTSLHSYYYKVDVVDPCGDNVFTSNYGKSILLKVEANNESKSNILTWSSYMDWAGGVKSYKVYRSVHGSASKFLETVSADKPTSYRDDVSDLTEQSEGLFCYYVEAEEGTPLFEGLKEPATSRSNEVCVVQYPLFYVPSAFTPGDNNSPGLNDVFKPEGVFVDLDGYKFEVFNRWGEKVFSTDQFTEGWDGTVEGKPAAVGSYIYFVKYKSADGKEFQQKGTVNITQ